MDVRATPRPVIVEIGKLSSKRIRRLKRGEELHDKIASAILQADARTGEGKQVVPVVIIYRKKDRRRIRGMAMIGPF